MLLLYKHNIQVNTRFAYKKLFLVVAEAATCQTASYAAHKMSKNGMHDLVIVNSRACLQPYICTHAYTWISYKIIHMAV